MSSDIFAFSIGLPRSLISSPWTSALVLFAQTDLGWQTPVTQTPSGHLRACSQLHASSWAVWLQLLSLCLWDWKSETFGPWNDYSGPRKQGHPIQTWLRKAHHSAGVPACESADRWGHFQDDILTVAGILLGTLPSFFSSIFFLQ